MNIALLILLVVVVVIAFSIAGIYNRLVKLRNRFKNSFAQIDVQLKRRYDLIPNLVETAKGYIKHERETLEAVVAARNQASAAIKKASADPTNASAIQGLAGAESMFGKQQEAKEPLALPSSPETDADFSAPSAYNSPAG